MTLPEGTVTFLFTDIERSTQTVAQMGNEAYADALSEHRRALREAFASHNGHEVGTEGDAFFVAFVRASEALQAARTGQRALVDHPLRVRMGLHTGEAIVREADYVGHDVHKAKRICDAGHGGQILLSQATADLVSRASLVDLGPHRLKDLGEPQRIFQLIDDALDRNFPPLRSLESFSTNLPLQRSVFIGRDHEIAEVRKHLERSRLVTLTGVGGCGKTRLALQVGAELLDVYPDGVFFIDLAPITVGDLIGTSLADAMGMSIGGGVSGTSATPLEMVIEALRRRRCVLILDNCEHLLDDVAAAADKILAQCGDVSLLATSREALEVEGEQSWRVPSLGLETDQPSDSEAVRLFIARASEIEPTLEIAGRNLDAVVEICRRLDGIPLAIEFAAARVSHLSPVEIASRLGDRFRLLTGGRRRVQRQQTLQAALDWSYDLLDETEQLLLRRLSVFAGSFALRAAENVCTDEHLTTRDVVDGLGSLVGKSLVATERITDVRYRLLETVRMYAEEKLTQSGEAETVRTQHRDHYLAWLESFSAGQMIFERDPNLAAERELDNIRRGVEWSMAQGRRDFVGRFALRLLGVWWFLGRFNEGHRWLAYAVEDTDALTIEEQVGCFASLAVTAMLNADELGLEYSGRAIELSGDAPREFGAVAFCQHALILALVAATSQSVDVAEQARETVRRGLAVAERVDPIVALFAIGWCGAVELVLLDVDAAVGLLAKSVEGLDRRKHGFLYTFMAAQLAVTYAILGDVENTGRIAETLQISDDEPEPIGGVPALGAAVVALAVAGRGHEAIQVARDWLSQLLRSALPLFVNEGLIIAAYAEFELGRFVRSSVLLAAARYAGGAKNMPVPFRSPPGYAMYVHLVGRLREQIDRETGRRCRDIGAAMTLDEAVAFALLDEENP